MADKKPLWAPWRMEYILSEKPAGCVFCDAISAGDDRRSLVLFRGKTCYVVLNLYPYNNGHMMVVPFRHVSDYDDLDSEEISEMALLVKKCLAVLKKAFRPEGFNVGLNLGEAAGAGIEEHLHTHIVPRWNGDTNYMPVVGGVKVIPQTLAETYDILKPGFE